MWNISKGVLYFLEGIFDILDKIWRFDFFNNDYVNKVFSGSIIIACSWICLKVVIELIMNHIVKSDNNSTPLSIYRGIVLAIVMMFLITPLFNFGYNFSTKLTDSIISVSRFNEGSNAETTISNSIIEAMVNKDETEPSDATYLVNNWKTIDINETQGGFIGIGDTYLYSVNFFMLVVASIVCIFLLFFVGLQLAKRVMEIALYKIIAPFCCTSLTKDGRAFSTWCKSVLGLFLITAVQFISIGLLLAMFNSSFKENGLFAGLFLLIGALLFIINTPTIISGLLDQQSGIMGGLGDIQSMIASGFAISRGLGVAKAGASSILSGGAKVVGGAYNYGKNTISKVLNRNSMNSEQMGDLKSAFENHNVAKAHQVVNNAIRENTNGKYDNVINMRKPINPIYDPQNPRFNHLRNQYSNWKNNNNNNGGKK